MFNYKPWENPDTINTFYPLYYLLIEQTTLKLLRRANKFTLLSTYIHHPHRSPPRLACLHYNQIRIKPVKTIPYQISNGMFFTVSSWAWGDDRSYASKSLSTSVSIFFVISFYMRTISHKKWIFWFVTVSVSGLLLEV